MVSTKSFCSAWVGGFEARMARSPYFVGLLLGPIRGVGGMMRTRGTERVMGGAEPVV